mmetsp:Transcript_46757/g.84397  ORF Transcript_46757/g.84397 Transcript_46757/m.84397 type:complete len:203 (+) Transcript_46757:660-1268(+)
MVCDVHESPRDCEAGASRLVQSKQSRNYLEAGDKDGDAGDLLQGVEVGSVCHAAPWHKVAVVLLVHLRVQGATVGCVVEGVVEPIVHGHQQHIGQWAVQDRQGAEPLLHTAGHEGVHDVMQCEVLHDVVDAEEVNVNTLENLELLALHVASFLEGSATREPLAEPCCNAVAGLLDERIVHDTEKHVHAPVVHEACGVQHPWE